MSEYEKESFDAERLAQFSSNYLARSLVDSRYLADSFGKRIAELESELAQYKEISKQDRSMLYWKVKELEAENARLREALQTIADECEIEFQWASNVAKGALRGSGEGRGDGE